MTYDWKREQADAIAAGQAQADEELKAEARSSRQFRWAVRRRRAVLFFKETWPDLLWSEFVALLAGITFRSVGIWLFVAMAVIAFHHRMWREVSLWRSRARAAEERAAYAQTIYADAIAAVENEQVVQAHGPAARREQVTQTDHTGAGYWIDDTYYPLEEG